MDNDLGARAAFMHSKRRSGIKAAIKEFNQTLVDKRIWAQWVSDCRMVGESDDGESIYEDQYTISGNCNGRPRPPSPKGALQPVLFIKKRGNELPSRFEIYESMQNYTVTTVPQSPYQVV